MPAAGIKCMDSFLLLTQNKIHAMKFLRLGWVAKRLNVGL